MKKISILVIVIHIVFFLTIGTAQAYDMDPSTDPVFSEHPGGYGSLLLMFMDEEDIVLFDLILTDLWKDEIVFGETGSSNPELFALVGQEYDNIVDGEDITNLLENNGLLSPELVALRYPGAYADISAPRDPAAVPEPSTFVFVGLGLIMAVYIKRRTR